VSEDDSAISQVVVVFNARLALWDELAREHVEARTQMLRNRRLLDWSVRKMLSVTEVMSGAGADVSCASCFPRAGSNVVRW
jgi:hypothetical protein